MIDKQSYSWLPDSEVLGHSCLGFWCEGRTNPCYSYRNQNVPNSYNSVVTEIYKKSLGCNHFDVRRYAMVVSDLDLSKLLCCWYHILIVLRFIKSWYCLGLAWVPTNIQFPKTYKAWATGGGIPMYEGPSFHDLSRVGSG
jgi:hypothetical protein